MNTAKQIDEYKEFLESKSQNTVYDGFKPIIIHDFLFDFQKVLVEWAVEKGKAAIFADCGLGKTPMQLAWADNVLRHTNKPVLIVTPIAVGYQTIREGEKFGIECKKSHDGSPTGNITVTNYERLHLFNPSDFSGVVCDESSILKNFDGKRKAVVTEFLRTIPYRLACTATAAPNDYIELGNTAEALGEMGFMDMLSRFYKNDNNTSDTRRRWSTTGGSAPKWRFKKHAEVHFWKWVASWARALRKPSDLGFDDDGFVLPDLITRETTIKVSRRFDGQLFVRPALSLPEQREERKITITERCEEVARKVQGNFSAVVWCHLNEEGDLLEKIIPDSKQVSGSDSEEKKEEIFIAFQSGQLRVLITKPKIGAFGLNWQHCSHITFFPSHSYEQYYQAVRRCWRFGQKNKVEVDIITSEGELSVLKNLQRKSDAADKMFDYLIKFMNDSIKIDNLQTYSNQMEVPSWL